MHRKQLNMSKLISHRGRDTYLITLQIEMADRLGPIDLFAPCIPSGLGPACQSGRCVRKWLTLYRVCKSSRWDLQT
jgi:hypothetical protein